jgi:hypothetical protein
LGYLHDFDLARELALTWIRPGAPLGNIASCSKKHLVALDYVAPVFPDMVLRAIEQASLAPEFASRKNENFTRFVRLLCHLAYEDETFDRAANMLLRFADTEKRDENNNSIVRQMRQLFSLHLSGTEATPERRQAFIQMLFVSGNPRRQEIARELLRSAFESRQWASFGIFHFGARKRGPGWHPKTHNEKLSWYVGHIQLLQPFLDSTQQNARDLAKSVLATHFRDLWTFAGCCDSLEQIIHDHGRNGNWPEMWVSIKKTLHFDANRHSPNLLARLESLEKLTSPSDPYSEIEAYVFVDIWRHMEVRGENSQKKLDDIYEKVITLGQLAASRPEYLARLGTKLWETIAQPVPWFGEGLAAGSSDMLSMFNVLVESFQSHRSERAGISLLEGYIRGVHESDPHQVRQVLEHALMTPELKPYAVKLLTAVPITPWTLRELLKLARAGELEASCFEIIGYGRTHEALSNGDLAVLLTEINGLERGYVSTLRVLSMRLFGNDEYTLNEELCSVARTAILRLVSSHRDELRQAQLGGIDHVLEEALSTSAPESEIKEIIKQLCEGIATYRLYAFELGEVITALVKKHPDTLLDAVFDGGDLEHDLGHSIFIDPVREDVSSLNDAPWDRILAWCGDDQERILKVAKATCAYSTSASNNEPNNLPKGMVLSEHIKSLLAIADDKLAMVEIIFDSMRPSSWSGSLAAILETRSKGFAELLAHPDPEVRAHVRAKLSLLEQKIHEMRDDEAAEYSKREQRFE